MGDGRPVYAFVDGDTEYDPRYPYHVVVDNKIVMKSRNAHKAKNAARCTRGQFLRTPVHPDYPVVVLCDFEKEEWRSAGHDSAVTSAEVDN